MCKKYLAINTKLMRSFHTFMIHFEYHSTNVPDQKTLENPLRKKSFQNSKSVKKIDVEKTISEKVT